MSASSQQATKKSLLDITQGILRLLKDDEVNSINDTTRAYDVAKIVEDAYYEYVLSEVIPEHEAIFQLEVLSDSEKPTITKLPQGVSKVHDIKYDKKKKVEDPSRFLSVCYEQPVEFLRRCYSRTNIGSNVQEQKLLNPDKMSVFVFTDRAPNYWTSFDDEYVIFDSYNSSVDDTIQNHKTSVMGVRTPDFCIEDSFEMDLSLQSAKYVEKRAAVLCFDVFKGYVPPQVARAEKKFKNRITNNRSNMHEPQHTWRCSPSKYGRRP